MDERPSLPHRIVDWFSRWVGALLPVAVVLLSAVAGVVAGHVVLLGVRLAWSTVLLIVLGPLALAAAVVATRQTRHLVELDDRNRALEAHVDVTDATILRLLRGELERLEDLAGHYSNQRVTLYRREENQLVLVARRSKCPDFDESLGRFCIPLDQGCVGKAWSEGSAYEPGLPSPGSQVGPPTKAWLTRQERWGIPENVATALTMRSQTYAAFRIETRKERLGVLVFESTLSVEERQGAAGISTTLLTIEELQAPVKDAAERLCVLLEASRALSRERLWELLCAQQCPAASHPAAQDVFGAAASSSAS